MALDRNIRKTLVIGSGPIVIGQAAEFDYAGTQACRVLRDAGVSVVLINSNPATIMTDSAMADKIYLEPLTVDTIKRIVLQEKPDSMLAGLGGQTGLTMAMKLSEDGFLQAHGVRLLGTSVEGIKKAEDRDLFKKTMAAIGQPLIPSDIANTVEDVLKVAEKIGYPVIVRPAFTLGGTGGGVANTPLELQTIASVGLQASPITQVLVEKYIFGWKEIEFETMRDANGTAVAVCSMENVDPVGVHTGDSIVVAPALTLTTDELAMLRQASLDIVAALGIIGGCNCQFALKPGSSEYAVIEVNPRVSRSSALASKASGYPIAKITAQLALGYTLDEIGSKATGKTLAQFEPALEYIVVKFPKWPFDKFVGASRKLGSQMKATGEVMSMAPTFEAGIMKAVRGAEIGLDSLNAEPVSGLPLRDRLAMTDDRRLFTIFEALKADMTVAEIADITKVTPWFIERLKILSDFERKIASGLSDEDYEKGKMLQYPDSALVRLSGRQNLPPSQPTYRLVDTCASVFDTASPYFYATQQGKCQARAFPRSGKPVIVVLGSGPIRIGQGIEFDYSSVHCVWALKELGYEVVIINNNPETVSTDYDTADRLYFEPLTGEDVLNVINLEQPVGVVVAFGGQTAIKLTRYLDQRGVRILGTSAEGIDLAEDRERFDELLERYSIRRPKGTGVKTTAEAVAAAGQLGYPVLLRPSYVIGGQNMMIVHNEEEVRRYMARILSQGIENPVLVDKYMMGIELEVDVISDGTDVLIPGIMEHIERAGVHSGDSIAVYPPYNIHDKMLSDVIESSRKLALSLGTRGLVNIQYLIYNNELYVIEVNPRASRTVPYISKVTGVPMVDLATRVMIGQPLKSLGYGTGLYKIPPYYAVKVPVFSFEKLNDVNAYLGPEMKSTGEVLGIGKTVNEALYKGLSAAGISIKQPWDTEGLGVFISVENRDHNEIVSLAKKLDDLGMKIYATFDTAQAIEKLGIDVIYVRSIKDSDEAFRLIDSGNISYVVYTGAVYDATVEDYIALHRRALQHGIPCLTSLDTANAVAEIIASRYSQHNTELVDINNMRDHPEKHHFAKMHACGDDSIIMENFDGSITCPESLCITLCDRHYGVGSSSLVLIEKSQVADARMRSFNRDGSEGSIAGNNLRCVGKYLYDHGYVDGEEFTVETGSGVKSVRVFTRHGEVIYATVDLGPVNLDPAAMPSTIPVDRAVNYPLEVEGETLRVTCVSIGNPHCVIFTDKVDDADLVRVGKLLEHSAYFPERVNTEYIRVANKNTVKMRVWESGNGEVITSGTGACAAVVAAVENGFCEKGEDIVVKSPGGDLIVNYTDDRITLTGNAVLVYEGEFSY